MRFRAIVLLGAGIAGMLPAQQSTQKDPLFDAMQDELKRSLTLSLGQLEHPYYLNYVIEDEHVWSATAALGALVGSSTDNYRVPSVRVRVGDYKFDNTNWTGAAAAALDTICGIFPLTTTTRWCSANIFGWPRTPRTKGRSSRLPGNAPRCAM